MVTCSQHNEGKVISLWPAAQGAMSIYNMAIADGSLVFDGHPFCCACCLQVRYREGVLSMLEAYEKGQAFEDDNYIVKEGEMASQYS